MQCNGAAFLFDRAKTGVIDAPVSRVSRQKGRRKIDHSLRISPHDFVQTLACIFIALLDSLQTIFKRAVTYVLVIRRIGLLLREEKSALLCGELKWGAREKQNIAGFQAAIVVFGCSKAETIILDGD